MKYGLLYYKETANIGDDIQTYAAKRFLPRVDYLVDRESLNLFAPDTTEYVSVIMNAWYMYNKSAWPPSPYINPLLISMHFSEDEIYDIGGDYLAGEAAKYLNKHGPVGARDDETKKRLEENGVKAYFSGCMTLTLNKFEDVKKQDYICIVDTNGEVINKIKNNTNKEIITASHNRNPEEMKNKAIEQRMKDVEKQLKMYQAASLVVTDRLHVALPTVALGTPVILLRNKDYGNDRIGPFEKFVTHYQINDFLEKNVKEDINNPKENNKDYLKIRNTLIKKCEEFIKKSEINNIEGNLPEVSEFKKVVDAIRWHNELFYKLKEKLEKSVEKNYDDVQELWSNSRREIEKLEKEIENKEQKLHYSNMKIEELQAELEAIYNSKTWKAREKLVKILNRKGK